MSKLLPVRQLLSLEDDKLTRQVIYQLDQDPTFDMVETLIGQFTHIRDLTKWMIGDILFFLRFRANYETVKIFQWNNSDLPDELAQYIRATYRVSKDDLPKKEPFLFFQVIRTERFWLLFDRDEIRVWQKLDRPDLDDRAFHNYIQVLSLRFSGYWAKETFFNCYRTSAALPDMSKRLGHPWSWFFEARNLTGGRVDEGLSGIDHHLAVAALMPGVIVELEENGHNYVSNVRGQIRVQNDQKNGFSWGAKVDSVFIDTEEGQIVVFEFNYSPTTDGAIRSILYNLQMWRYSERVELIWRDVEGVGILNLPSGELVATCPNQNHHLVAGQVAALSIKMGWELA